MSHLHFEKWVEPIRAIAELNIKTIQELTYLKPNDYANVKSPEELVEKQIQVALDNGSKMVEHIQKSYEIVEKAMMTVISETRKQSKH